MAGRSSNVGPINRKAGNSSHCSRLGVSKIRRELEAQPIPLSIEMAECGLSCQTKFRLGPPPQKNLKYTAPQETGLLLPSHERFLRNRPLHSPFRTSANK